MERHADAAEGLAAALRTVAPVLDKEPGPIVPLAASLMKDYLASIDNAGLVPDHELVGPIADVLEASGFAEKSSDEPSAPPPFDPDQPRPDAAEPEKLAQYLLAQSRYLKGEEHFDGALEAIEPRLGPKHYDPPDNAFGINAFLVHCQSILGAWNPKHYWCMTKHLDSIPELGKYVP